eukprot:125634-Pleurochrysis_carterae.AAC.3
MATWHSARRKPSDACSSRILSLVENTLPGMAKNVSGVPKACGFTTVHDGGRGPVRAVGVLVGQTADEVIAGEPVYEMHPVCSTAFGATGTRTRRASGAGQPPSMQDRLGCHTFCRGDIVTYTAKREGDIDYEAVVFGVLVTGKKDNEQGRKLLV